MNEKQMEIYRKLSTLQHGLHRYHMINREINGMNSDVTRGQGRVLAMLKVQSGISTKDLAYLLGIRTQSLNELLGKLEASGYVERKASEEDKRVMLVYITEKGKGKDKEENQENNLGEVFDCLNEEEQEILDGYLVRLIETLESIIGNDNRDDMEEWMKSACRRMGSEKVEELMEMGRGFGHHGKGHCGKGMDMHGHGHHCNHGGSKGEGFGQDHECKGNHHMGEGHGNNCNGEHRGEFSGRHHECRKSGENSLENRECKRNHHDNRGENRECRNEHRGHHEHMSGENCRNKERKCNGKHQHSRNGECKREITE
ncbi:MAG: MarR family transcriptional regulator [Peptostreptococcus sp.]|uniref:MarR family winged helix-turn-helix transcriptional regulator n=1 Tax=Peptostreptococcus sp. TaxID=1262 RepID=UPI002FC9B0E3